MNEKQTKEEKYLDSDSTFSFGNGNVFKNLDRVEWPASIGSKIFLYPLLLLTQQFLLLFKEMKMKAGTSIDFVSDGVAIFGQRQKVLTRSGHYAIFIEHFSRYFKNVWGHVDR